MADPPTGALAVGNPAAGLPQLAITNTPVAINFVNVQESAADNPSGLHYSFALDPSGLATDYADAGTSTTASFTFTAQGTYPVYGRIFDAGGGSSDYSIPVPVATPTAPVQLDPTFGNGGLVTGSNPNSGGPVLAVQPDGKIVVASTFVSGSDQALELARYNPDGSLDTTFGTNGVAVNYDCDGAGSVAVLGDGSILVAGSALPTQPGLGNFFLARYTPGGQRDTSFGSSGTPGETITSLGGLVASGSDHMVVLSGGDVLLCGAGYDPSGARDYLLARFTPGGALDPHFGNQGVVLANGLPGEVYDLAVSSTGTIVAVGSGPVACFNPDGSFDTNFNNGQGWVWPFTTTGGPDAQDNSVFTSVLLQANGDIVAAGNLAGQAAAVRYTPGGALDPTFGVGGSVLVSYGYAAGTGSLGDVTGMVAQPDGKLLLLGPADDATNTGRDSGVARLTADGQFDPTFGSIGMVSTDFAGNITRFTAGALQPDGKLVATGWTLNTTTNTVQVALARYLNTEQVPAQADPGGPYTVPEGGTVVLSGSGNAPGSVLSEQWYLVDPNGDEVPFGNGWGMNPPLQASRLGGPGTYTVGLSVFYANGLWSPLATTTVTVSAAAPTTTTLTSSANTPLPGDTVTLTATVADNAPSSDTPTGTVDFFDSTTNTDLTPTPISLVNGVAVLPVSTLSVGGHTITATYNPDPNFLSSTGSTSLKVIPPASLSGLVYEDFNGDGQVDFGEAGIAGATITLTGTDDLGDTVSQSQKTDADGCYLFGSLRPGNYYLTETQPAGYGQGIDSVGTAGGSLAATDRFFVQLGAGVNGMNYNYGEQPPAGSSVQSGQTATIGFWNNTNGQNLILALNGGPGSTQLANWLAATLPNIFGQGTGASDLAGKTNADVAALFQSDFLEHGQKLDAQVLATALSVYVTNATLDSNQVGASYGFVVSGDGVGTATCNVGSNGDAFGVANNATLTVMDLLLATDDQAGYGLLYGGNSTRRNEANNVYSAINQAGDIS